MWIYLNDAFVSIVEHKDDPKMLHVRARKEGDIERAFGLGPSNRILHTPTGDYKYRVDLLRDFVAGHIKRTILGIDYSNFKNSIDKADHDRHGVYLDIWSASHGLHSVEDTAAGFRYMYGEGAIYDEDQLELYGLNSETAALADGCVNYEGDYGEDSLADDMLWPEWAPAKGGAA